MKTLALMLLLLSSCSVVAQASYTEMQKVYKDETHCLTAADMRGEKDNPISCYCRDAIADARYVYRTYLLSGKDRNLEGTYLALLIRIDDTCGKSVSAMNVVEDREWKWDGPEVVRTYPPDDTIARIAPEMRDGKPVARWVPFTIQLVYRDSHGRVSRTENYSARELIPVFAEKGQRR